ncbi:MAG TPA: NAD(P)-binding domain-containing protein [Vicinamibacterales bacterium]|nr:NAD(P)-binding domain-containing protein [Vicinamibacterales bacterium]
MRIGVIGSATVGQTLASGLKQHGYDVRIGSRTPAKLADFSRKSGITAGTFADVAAWSEALVLAVKGTVAADALTDAGIANLGGKLVIDTTNPIADEPPEDGVLKFFTTPNESLMERLQATFPDARFVKAFNSVGSALMVNPAFPGGAKPTMFYCGNDAAAKATVAAIVDRFGWGGADMGTAKAARAIEPLCQLWCIPGFRNNSWTNHAFHLMTR